MNRLSVSLIQSRQISLLVEQFGNCANILFSAKGDL